MTTRTALTWGEIPHDMEIDEPFEMCLNKQDFKAFAAIVNQGIDSHLEAVFATQDGPVVTIKDTASMRCFLRRCVESGDSIACDLASSIVGILGYEWI